MLFDNHSSLYSVLHSSSFNTSSPTIQIASLMYHIPISWRKLALQYCRVQQNIFSNIGLSKAYADIVNSGETLVSLPDPEESGWVLMSPKPATVSLRSFANRLHAFRSPVELSFLSFIARQEGFSDDSIPILALRESFDKEVAAALNAQDMSNRWPLNFDVLTEADGPGVYTGAVRNLHECLRSGLLSLKMQYSSPSYVLVPTYSKRKNTSWESQQNLIVARGEGSLNYPLLTQFEVLRHYHETGQRITGECEIRQVWRGNDLKPRTYYCSGATAFFASCYLERVVHDLQDILPATNTFSRYDPRRLFSTPLSESEILVTYDYSSFTTNLHDLSLFIYHLAEVLDHTRIRVLDVYVGVIEIDLTEYLHEYNDIVNSYGAFSVFRQDPDNLLPHVAILYQQNNGMLGVPGNIGLSTFLHGIQSCSIYDNLTMLCVVGDDALVRWLKEQLRRDIEITNRLGSIPDAKFAIFHPCDPLADEDDPRTPEAWQFLKRPCRLDTGNMLQEGMLLTFPDFSAALCYYGAHRTSRALPPRQSFETFISRLTFFYDRLLESESALTEQDATLIYSLVKKVYNAYHIPKGGMLIGDMYRTHSLLRGYAAGVFVPPLDMDVFSVGWLRSLLRKHDGKRVRLPLLRTDETSGTYIQEGETQTVVLHRLQILASDLGYLRVEKKYIDMEIDIQIESCLEYIEDIIYGRRRPVYDITCVKQVPGWYNDAVMYDVDVEQKSYLPWMETGTRDSDTYLDVML